MKNLNILIVEGNLKEENYKFTKAGIKTHTESLTDSLNLLDDNLFFDGAYQVSKVQSTMNQGQFLQTLTLVRLNNQSTFGFGDLESAASGELSSVIEDKKKDIEYDIKKQFVEPFGKYQRY